MTHQIIPGSEAGSLPPKFVLRASSRREVESLNDVGYLPLAFRSIDDDLNLLVEGIGRRQLRIWRTRSEQGFETVSKGALDRVSVRFSLKGRILLQNGRHDYVLVPNSALMLLEDPTRDHRVADALDGFLCTFPLQDLVDLQATIDEDGELGLDFEPLIELKTPALAALAYLMRRILETMQNDPQGLDLTYPLLVEALIARIVTAWPRRAASEPRPVGTVTTRQILAATDYIDANLGRPIYVGEVARAVGLNVRALQVRFRREMGETLVRYIVGRRLGRVRLDLLRDDALLTVAQAAHRWGFVNLSDFSKRYKERFSEFPSDTLRRSRG